MSATEAADWVAVN